MTLLGNFALWAALLFGIWGAVLAFSNRWQGRPEIALSVTRSVYAVFASCVVASIALWKGIIAHDFNIEYVWAYTSRNLPSGIPLFRVLGRPEGLLAVLGGGALLLRDAGPGDDTTALRAAHAVCGGCHASVTGLLRGR